jgi:hypothetical protein
MCLFFLTERSCRLVIICCHLFEMNFRYFLRIVVIIIVQAENTKNELMIENLSLVHNLIRRIFSSKQCLYTISSADLTQYTAALLNVQLVSVDLNNIKSLNRITFMCEGYIIFSNDSDDMNTLFTLKLINTYFKPHKNILLFTESPKNINIQEMYRATELHDLNLIIVDMKRNTELGVGKRRIFMPEEGTYTLTPIRQLHNDQSKWSPDKVLTKFNQKFSVALFNCPPFAIFNETTNTYEGLEIKMLNEILNNWPKNYVFLTAEKDSGKFLYTTALDRVLQDNYDLAICSPWQQAVYNYYNVAKSIEYAMICKQFLVPRPKLLPNYSFIFQSLQSNVWLVYFLTLIGCSAVTHITGIVLNKFSSSYSQRQTLEATVIQLIRVFSLGSFYQMPHQNKSSVKLILTSVCVFCLLMSTYYSAGLTTSLRFPRYSKKIDSLQDIVENNIKWLDGSEWMKDWMKNTTNELLHKLADQFETYDTLSERNRKMMDGNYAIFVQTLSGITKNYYVMFTESLNEYGRKKFKIVTENVGCFYAIFPLKENSPYVDIFNRAIQNFMEFGLMNYWFQDFTNKPKYRFMRNFFQQYSAEVHQIIDFEKLQGVFFLIVIGHAISVLVFILECVISRY